MFLIMTSKFLDLPLDPSIFLIYVCNIFLGCAEFSFTAAFEDTFLYEISKDFCHLKYMYCFSLELAVLCFC